MTLAAQLVKELKNSDAFITTVESCTGGLIATLLTDVTGASDVFWGSLVTYDNSAKEALAGVATSALQTHGAVSGEVALEMAQGGLKRLQEAFVSAGTRWRARPSRLLSVAVTGIAGPTGGTPAKPVGLCFIAVVDSAGKATVERIQAPPTATRAENRTHFADRALALAATALSTG